MAKVNYIKLPFNKLFTIWRTCYIENPSERAKLDELDIKLTKRGFLVTSGGNQFIQLTQSEMLYIKNLYESLI